MKTHRIAPFALAVLLVASHCLQLTALAQTASNGVTWDNTGSEWSDGASWVGDNAPTNNATIVGNTATFSNAAAGFNTVNLSTAQGIYGLLFVAGANAYTFTGSALTIRGQANSISNGSTSVQTFSNKIINTSSSGGVYGSVAGGSLIFAGGIDLSLNTTARTNTFGLAGDILVSGAIADGGGSSGGGVIVTNQGLTIFSGNNTYTGGSAVNSGATFRLGSATALGATNGGTTVNSGGSLDLNGQVIGGEALTINGTGVSSSGVVFNSSSSAASWSGTIAPAGNSTIKATNGSITLSGGIDLNNTAAAARTLTLDGTGGIVLSGNISNSFAGSTGNIAIAGNASLSGNNTYNGTTTINSGGVLNLSSSTGLGSTAAGTTVSAGGQLRLSGGITVDAGEALTLGGTDGSVASLRNVSGNNTFSGGITFSGTNRIDSDAGTLTLSSFANGPASTRGLNVGGAGNTLFAGRLTGTGTIPLTKDGNGTLTFANTNNDLGGGILVNAGTVALATNDALGATRAVAINGGALDIATFNNTVGAVGLTNGSITGTTGVLTGSSYAVENGTISAILGGSGVLTKSGNGTVILSGANTYSGGTLVNVGELAYGANNALNNSGAVTVSNATLNIGSFSDTVGAVVVTNGGRIIGTTGVLSGTSLVSGSENLTNTISANLGGIGGLSLAGNTNTTVLSGSNSYSGSTKVDDGVSTNMTLRVSSVAALSSNSSLAGPSASARTPTLDLNAAGSYKMNSYAGGYFTLVATNGASSLTFTNVGSGNFVSGGGRTITSSNVAVIFDGSVDISPTTTNKTLILAGNGDFTFKGAIVNTNPSFTAGLTVNSTGTTVLNASNNYDGVTAVGAGATLRLANSYALGAANALTNTVSSGGAVQLQGGIMVDGEILSLNGRGVSDDGVLRNISGNNTFNGPIEVNATNRINSDSGTLTLGAFTNGLNSGRSLIIGGAGNTVMAGALSGTGTGQLVKDGTGTLTISAANTVNGGVVVGAGSLIVESTGSITAGGAGSVTISNGASLRYNGTSALVAGSVNLGGGAGRAVLGGNGTINSSVALDSLNDVLSPGNSPGTLFLSQNQSWNAFTYDWEINNFPGTVAGADFDNIAITGTLNLTGSYGLNVLSLTAGNVPGNVPNFSETNTTWTILSASGGITGFDAGNWTIDASGFTTGTSYLGSFSLSQPGLNEILLTYTVPEPSTFALLGAAALGWGAWFVRRRRKS